MAIHTSLVITPANSAASKEMPATYSSLLLFSLVAVAANGYSKKQLGKAKNKMARQLFKMQLKNLFSFRNKKANRAKAILIVLGLAFFAAMGIFLSWTIAISLLVVFGLIAIIFSARD
jgi:hypothetical protein